LSFTRTKKDVEELKEILQTNNSQIKIVAKIENQEGIENVDEIMDVSDMIMVARGDLGTELPVEMIPLHQMNIVRKCRMRNIPVIVATQMLESMISAPIPTRAEVSDIFYAVLEKADYVMLS
jgi:pyruvate kinase